MVSWISLLISLVTAFSLYLVVRELYFVKLYATNPRPRAQSQGPIVGSKVDGLLSAEVLSRLSERCITAIVFTSANCSICRAVKIEELASIATSFEQGILLLEVTDNIVGRLSNNSLILDRGLAEKLGIQVVPHLLIVDRIATVQRSDLVNNPAQVENALEVAMLSRSNATNV
jgi:hypothetical protein